MPGFAGVEVKALESGEGEFGGDGRIWRGEVEFGDFVAGRAEPVFLTSASTLERVAGFQGFG